MERSDLLALIEKLDPDNSQIRDALVFLRLVVANNPKKTADEIAERTDVQEAIKIIDEWIDTARETVKITVDALPAATRPAIIISTGKTLNTLKADTRINPERVAEWRTSEDKVTTWVAVIILRIQWFVEWLIKQVEGLTLGAPYKKWQSRLAPNTCKYCRALHGAILPVGKSFASEASKVGWKRVYGGLYAPPLHPSCLCVCLPVTQAEYDALKSDTKK